MLADSCCPELESIETPSDFQPTAAVFLYGSGIHPVMLAREWALLINGRDILKFIEEHDEDGDGKLDVEEVRRMLAKRGLYEGAEELIAVGDLNGDGKIDADELYTLLQRNNFVSYKRRSTVM
eukprot:scaffold2782_cov182-Amphora_coffeaeformis.AAC.25